ncbi:MAG: O-acetyl-ADP-ribose deacetylase [Planctomycetota bacterium]|jgi:O-acetyl-ADP-ribose deacetylase (regulator of RNase III)
MRVGTTELVLRRGDITKETADVIVNAANSSLLGGGGVDGAIHRAGGPAITEDCKRIRAESGKLPTGEAVITTGGDLGARHVVHTVGPIWGGGSEGEPALLRSCYERSLALAAEHGASSIAFPAISTGVYGYPVEKAALVALGAAADFARESEAFAEIRFVLFSDRDLEVYRAAISELKEEA